MAEVAEFGGAGRKVQCLGRDGAALMLAFHCPGCGYDHPFHVGGGPGKDWSWNGSLVSPTFSPSLLVNGSAPGQRCHLFVRDGKIEYCSDCDHALAGKTVDMEYVE